MLELRHLAGLKKSESMIAMAHLLEQNDLKQDLL